MHRLYRRRQQQVQSQPGLRDQEQSPRLRHRVGNYLKNSMLRIYGKFVTLHAFIRRAILHVSFQVIYECEMNNDEGKLPEFPGITIKYFAPIPETFSKI